MDKNKRTTIIAWVEVIGIIIISIWIASINHYRAHYEKAEPLSYEEACEDYELAAGYPPGKDIPVAKSVADIMEYEYCTIEVSKEDIVATRTFLIKEFVEAGDFYTKAGRNHVGKHVDARYGLGQDWLSNILHYIIPDNLAGIWMKHPMVNGVR